MSWLAVTVEVGGGQPGTFLGETTREKEKVLEGSSGDSARMVGRVGKRDERHDCFCSWFEVGDGDERDVVRRDEMWFVVRVASVGSRR